MIDQAKKVNMNELLERNIKEVITQYPSLGTVLNEFNIGCVTCSAGSCKFRDIVSIHSLSPDEETALFRAVAGIVYPGRDVEMPVIERKAAGRKVSFSPPIQELVEEHKYIKRVLALIPAISGKVATGLDDDKKALVTYVVDFIRNYADRFHHAKEEDILFKYFDQGSDILVAMLKEHEIGRAHVRAVLEGVERNDAKAVAEHLTAYGDLLREHIKKEDEILYPWMQSMMSDSQVGRLFSEFRAVDEKFGDKPGNYRLFVEGLERSINKGKEQL